MTVGKSVLKIDSQATIIRETPDYTTILQPARTLVIQSANIPGPQGPQGPPGGGGGGGGTYLHDQPIANDTWTIVHNLGFFPNVTTFDTANDEIIGSLQHIDNTTLTITFSVAVSGEAYLS